VGEIASNLRRTLPKNEVIILNAPKTGTTYSNVIRKVKEAIPNLEELGSEMIVRRPTRTVPVLISGLDKSTTAEELRAELAKRNPELESVKTFSIRTASNG